MKLKIYLAGQMSKKYETSMWRKNIEKYIIQLPEKIKDNIEIINPFLNKRSVDYFVNYKTSHEKNLSIVPIQDAGYIKESNMCIVNLQHYSKDRPIIGTFFELSLYCFMYPDKPVIGIFDGDISKDYQCTHEFVNHAVHTWVKNEIEAIELVVESYFPEMEGD